MEEKKRFIYLIAIMLMVSITGTFATIIILYNYEIKDELHWLKITAQSNARLMEAMAEHGIKDHDSASATLAQFINAQSIVNGFDKTGECLLGRKSGENIVLLYRKTSRGVDRNTVISCNLKKPGPMRLALSGKSGIMTGLDYRRKAVLAAYEPVAVLNYGIVVKIDLSEIRSEFIIAAVKGLTASIFIVLLGAFFFIRISRSILNRGVENDRKLRDTLEERVQRKTRDLVRANELLDTINRAQSRFISNKNLDKSFNFLLKSILELTRSEYGFIGEALQDNENKPYLKAHAITNIALSEENRAFCAENADPDIKFRKMHTLYGAVMTSNKPVIANDPPSDIRSMGVPHGHPPLNSFLGIPIFNNNKLTGVIGMANRPGGYNETICKFLDPFMITCAHIIDALRTDEKRRKAESLLKMSESRNKQIIETSSQGFWILDNKYRIIEINSAMSDMLGVARAEAAGISAEVFIFNDDIKIFKSEIKRREKGLVSNFYLSLEKKDGNEIPCQVSASPIFDEKGEKTGCFAIFADITKLKSREKELLLLNEKITTLNKELEQKVEDRTADLKKTLKKAEEANAAKSDFLAGISHELRTPLNAVIGFSQVLEKQYFGKLNEKQSGYVKDILESGQHLLSLINEILDISNIEAGKMPFKPDFADINNLVETSLAMVSEKALQKQIKLEFRGSEKLLERKIYADEKIIKQILYNLNTNAVKFTPTGGRISLSTYYVEDYEIFKKEFQKDFKCQCGRNETDKLPAVVICVEDTGIGISNESGQRIFDNFYQVNHGYSDKTKGTGLGLPLTKHYVKMHGGKIWVESDGPGKGSRFYILLPDRT